MTALTRAMREVFLDEVMESIPRKHHYNREDALQEIRNAVEAQLPKEITDFAAKYPHLVQRNHWIQLDALMYSFFTDKGFLRTKTPEIRTLQHPDAKLVDLTPWVLLKEAYEAEEDQRLEYRKRLAEIVASCTTLKKLRETLPELESYMPAEPEKRNLPVAAGTIITELLAAGLKVPKENTVPA